MEIISFVGSSAAVKKSYSSSNFTLPRISKVQKKNPVHKSPEIVVALDKAYSKTERQFTVAGISKILSIFVLFAFHLIVPYTVFNLLSFVDNHTTSIVFDSNSDYEYEALSGAMSRFAMYDTLADNVDENGNVLSEDGSILTAASVGIGEKVTFQNYTVKAGDSISTISRKFGLSNISTLIAVNDISNVRTLRSGQKLRIPSTDGLVYKVQAGDSLNSLSVKYHVSVEEILDANDLSSDTLAKDMALFIPGAKMDTNQLRKAMGELFSYPIKAAWRLTSRFGPRSDPFTGVASNHTGIDMACPTGTPIRAAMSGRVAYVGWSNIFGNYIIINHGGGYQTLYGHMSQTLAKKGQAVDQSTKIGLVGSTGYSTGPHLHFTVYKNGNLVDPLTLLKR
ncbi:M23 family peptidase [Treponema ruminis]|uniref:Murein DD-endopeptidase MepM/ murein hydrolase activator NlpD n=1 Tax=Treponema ruminis TaxID=744515 RepID=A0A7W8LMI7_9SPIR|nr:M23 family metallopeptidase [Treponema ruminis]MBB5226517.1 murein DD-endopeptidase MepM/ murein hydrolase activator NlpD [Treponema ruminis]QSI02579.1 M23 family peptidase [Treponema ruminis]